MTVPFRMIDVPPYRLSGTVVGALLNHAPQLAALGDAMHQAPYKAPPVAPVLAIRPRNTLEQDGAASVVPAGVAALEIGASLGIVIGRAACRVPLESALDFVTGYTIVSDLGVPVPSHYRPSVRLKARDGFCVIASHVVRAADLRWPDALGVTVRIDGAVRYAGNTGERVRGVAQLIADVSEFMTLQAGDLVLLGAVAPAPMARAGERIEIEIEGLGCLRHSLIEAAE